jgi:hypothetical protein
MEFDPLNTWKWHQSTKPSPRFQSAAPSATMSEPTFHESFEELLNVEQELLEKKNAGYAGSGDPLGNFRRVAHLMENYPKFKYAAPEGICLFYMLKHFDAILWAFCDEQADTTELKERLVDISIYSKLIILMLIKGDAHGGK